LQISLNTEPNYPFAHDRTDHDRQALQDRGNSRGADAEIIARHGKLIHPLNGGGAG
jgi:hypothetical protein